MSRTIALYGPTGSGKTTQIGELAKDKFKHDRLTTDLYSADLGGFDSVLPHIKLGLVKPTALTQADDPWTWLNGIVEHKPDPGVGLVAFDLGTSMSEVLLNSCAKLSAGGEDIGGRPAPKFVIGKRGPNPLRIGTNVDSHYNVVQQFMLDAIWRSTWLATETVDVLWTFALHRGEDANSDPVLGPKLAGKALTAAIPKWFKYTFRIDVVANDGTPARHILYLEHSPDRSGLATSLANSRYPLDATSPLPSTIEPASLTEAFRLIQQGQDEALENLKMEVGL